MRGGITIGRIFGIHITIDWSWILIFLFVTWNLAVAVIPASHPFWGPWPTWGLAVVSALLFFASVLVHELAHSLVARAQGLPVRDITLFLFGGVSNIEHEPPSPRVEFLVTIVGPITSLVLGGILLGWGVASTGGAGNVIDYGTRTLYPVIALSTVLLWLGPVNLALGVFNLIPGFPLDGGRILRSTLWAATHNLRAATRWAARVGQAIGWLIAIGGIAMIFGVWIPGFGTGFLSGLWLVIIGWFLVSAAQQSYRQIMLQSALQGVTVAQLMRSSGPTTQPTTPIGDLVNDPAVATDERALPVLQDDDHLAGLICPDDLRKVPREAWDTTTAREIMTPVNQVPVMAPQEDVGEALSEMEGRDVEQAPVIQDGRLVGMLRRRDILQWLRSRGQNAA